MILPKTVQEKIAGMPETSYGANRVTLVLKDGKRIPDVVVAWSEEIVRVGERDVKDEKDLGFDLREVIDATL